MQIDESKDGRGLTSTLLEICTMISWTSEMDVTVWAEAAIAAAAAAAAATAAAAAAAGAV